MKTFVLSIAVLLFLQSVSCDNEVATKKCEDFFPAKPCETLRAVAKKFNEKVEIVNQAVTDAYNHHKTKAVEMLNYVKEYMVARATNFKCENVISADSCAKITDLGQKLKLSATQVSIAVKEAIVNGATKAQDIYTNAVNYMRDRLSNLKCSDIISQDNCDKLTKVAELIKVKSSEINRAIREAIVEGANSAQDYFNKAMAFLESEAKCDAVLGVQKCDMLRNAAKELGENIKTVHQAVVDALNKHLTNAAEILKSVQETLVEKATNFKCEDALGADQCAKIKEIGQKFKLKSSEILTAVKEAIVNSPAKAKEIYDRSVGFLMDFAKNFKCEDVLQASTCTTIRENAQKLGAKASDVSMAVKEAIVSGAKTAADYVKQATEYLKAKMSCDKVLSAETCDKIRSWADRFHVSLQEVDAFLRTAIANGVTKVTDLCKAAIEFITDKWLGIFGDEPEKEKRDLSGKVGEIREKVKAVVAKLLAEGKIRLDQIKQKIKELMEKYTKASSDEAVSVYRRSLKEEVVETLKQVHGKAKELLEKFLKLSKEQFAKVKSWIKEKLEKDGVTTRGDELDSDFEYLQSVLDDATEDVFSNIVADAVNMAHQQ